ncbi:MAG: hypothetical protein JW846_07620 [Dehalococcoidia bacterium]|nr:hypothetical protein [Dehalococcoidia bacterium]
MRQTSRIPTRLPGMLAILMLLLSPSSPASADDVIHVTDLGDSGSGTLREAILDANTDSDHDEIVFDKTGIVLLTSGPLIITEDLTITGPGWDLLVISGGGSSGIIVIDSPEPEVCISDVELTDGTGWMGELGGAVVNSCTLTMTGCRITGNNARVGGGLANVGNLTMTDCVISGNSSLDATDAFSGGDGIFGAGAGIFNAGSLNLTDCTISDNHAVENVSGRGGGGGGIYNATDATVEMTRCAISSNIVDENDEDGGCGGGILSLGSTLTMTSCSLDSNEAGYAGGGIASAGPVLMSRCTVNGNIAWLGGGGGGILTSDDLQMSSCTVGGNTAWLGGGGGILTSGDLQMVNCTISTNSAFVSGGGIYETGGLATLTHCTIAGNSTTDAAGKGGGIRLLSTSSPVLELKNSIIADNTTAGHPDCSGSITTHGCNIIGDDAGCVLTPVGGGTPPDLLDTDPQLGPLQDNGGPTQTHAVGIGSPALDAVAEGYCSTIDGDPLSTDQRGEQRPGDSDHDGVALCDIGAFEFNTGTESVYIDVEAGWNMVSVPLCPADPSPHEVFEDSEAVYTWDPSTKSYVVPDEIEPWRGYWVAMSSEATIEVTGTTVTHWTQPNICTGWNMIGSIHGQPCGFDDPVDDPPGSLEGFAYWWDPETKSYVYCKEIEPCRGYWAAATCDCTLSLD